MNTDETTTLMDSSAQEFVNILHNGTYEQLLKLYYYYKGFYMTGTADFIQQVVVEFMEEYCIEIKNNSEKKKRKAQLTIEPIDKHSKRIKTDQTKSTFSRKLMLSPKNENEVTTEVHFGDDWDTDFEDATSEQPTSLHPSTQCETIYACNTGLSRIPTVFESHLYFRKDKFYLDLLSDPFHQNIVEMYFLYRFLYILHVHTTSTNSVRKNPWNFTLYYPEESPETYVIKLDFQYNNNKKKHELQNQTVNNVLNEIINDMDTQDPYMTVFLTGYTCNAGWGNNGTVGGGHAVMCGILKQNENIFIFILDSNGVQIEKTIWWQKYTSIFLKNTNKKMSNYEMVDHFFNEQIVQVLINQIKQKSNYPTKYRYKYDTKLNLNPYNMNPRGSEYQQDAYCVIVTIFFMHLLYNNIALHNRDLFFNTEDSSTIIQYIKELMIFMNTIIKTPPFTKEDFFYNYSINIFRFMLSTQHVENFYNVHDLEQTIETVNNDFSNTPELQNHFIRITSANVLIIYMTIVIEGMKYIPAFIGVPKLSNKSNFKNLLIQKDYSCIRFYTPFRKIKVKKDQPLRLWFYSDPERILFGEKNIVIRDHRRSLGVIEKPSFILLNLEKVIHLLADKNNYRLLIKDFLLMTPTINISIPYNSCENVQNPHTITNTNSTTNTKSSCVIS